jgi:hypothetical protein
VKKPILFPRSGRRPPWPAPKPRRRAPAPPFPTTIHPATDTNRKRRSTRTYLRGLGRLRRSEEGTRLGKGGGAIADSLELRKHAIQSTTIQKKSMERKRRRWRTHQSEEEELKPTRKLRRRATETSRFPQTLMLGFTWLGSDFRWKNGKKRVTASYL